MATSPFSEEQKERPPAHAAVSDDDVDAAAEQYRADTDGIREALAAGRSDTGYNDPQSDDYNTDFATGADTKTSR
jgi:hypothetical protein